VLWVRPPALRAGLECAETILSAGGFGLLVLDLDGSRHSLPPKIWIRLTRIAKKTGTVLIVLSRQRLAGNFAALSLALELQRIHWTRFWHLLEGVAARAVVVRDRFDAAGRSICLGLSHGS